MVRLYTVVSRGSYRAPVLVWGEYERIEESGSLLKRHCWHKVRHSGRDTDMPCHLDSERRGMFDAPGVAWMYWLTQQNVRTLRARSDLAAAERIMRLGQKAYKKLKSDKPAAPGEE